MKAFVWSGKFVTGLAPIDGQHQRLVHLINAFGELSVGGTVAAGQLAAALSELSDYAHSHFAEEEGLMISQGLDPRFVAQHRAQHEHFIRRVEEHSSSGADGDAQELFRFLVGWLAFHILGWDQQTARQLRHKQQGRTAADAYLLEFRRTDSSAGFLLEAIDDLLGVVTDRNRALAAANQALEARVAERTAELTTVNAELVTAMREREQTQQQLLQTEKMASLGTLAAGAAHEINNPLGFVKSNLATLEGGLLGLRTLLSAYRATEDQLGAEARAAIDRAKKAADVELLVEELPSLLAESKEGLERVGRIVSSLGELAHLREASWSDVDLQRSLDAATDLLGSRSGCAVTFVKEYGPAPLVRGLGAHLSQALLGVLMNAVQAIADRGGGPGLVTLRTGVEAGLAWVEIADTGVGMSEETRAHAFEPFFSTRPVGGGVGLGLSVVWAIAQRHGGRIEAASTVGEGSTFRLWLPVKGPENLSEEAASPGAPGVGRYAIR